MKKRLKQKCIWPKTLFLFPVETGAHEQTSKNSRDKQRGVALLIAVLAVGIVMTTSANMIVNSQVELESALKYRDRVKAEYLARSAVNLANFLLVIDLGIDLLMKRTQNIEPSDGVGDIWAMLNGLPIGGQTIEAVTQTSEQLNLNKVNDEKAIDVLSLFQGQFVLNVKDESSRININQCVDGRCINVLAQLQALMTCPAEKIFLEKKGLSAQEMAYRIKDWVDKDSKSPNTGFSSENDPYLKNFPPYEAKNAPMDTLDELKLVEGWDDDMHAVFSPYLTVYPFLLSGNMESDINLNTADRALLACLVPEARLDCYEKFQLSIYNRDKDTLILADSPKAIRQVLADSFCYKGKNNPKDPEEKSNWFSNRSDVYRIEATGVVGDQSQKIELVIERTIPDPAKKMDHSYKILYWKLL